MAITKGPQDRCSSQGSVVSSQVLEQGLILGYASQTQLTQKSQTASTPIQTQQLSQRSVTSVQTQKLSQNPTRRSVTSFQDFQQNKNLSQRSHILSQPLYHGVCNLSKKSLTPSEASEHSQNFRQKSQTPTSTPQKVYKFRQRTPTEGSQQEAYFTPARKPLKQFNLSQASDSYFPIPRKLDTQRHTEQNQDDLIDKSGNDGKTFSVLEKAIYYLNFYHLRSRTVPVLKPSNREVGKTVSAEKLKTPVFDDISIVGDEKFCQESPPVESKDLSVAMLMAQYGIYDYKNKEEASRKEATGAQISKLHLFSNILGVGLLLLSYGCLCIFLHSYFFPPANSFFSLLLPEDNINRLIERNILLHYQNDKKHIQDLGQELNNFKYDISMCLMKCEENQKNQNAVLEELLIADLASSGNSGSVLATPETVPALVSYTASVLGLLTFNIDKAHNSPDVTLQGIITQIGDCWAFKSKQGRLVLKLRQPSVVTGVSISHITPSSSPTGDISSAPKHFQVLAHQIENELENGFLLGDFEYKHGGPWRQTFSLARRTSLIKVIEFRFLENHGNPNFTCVYRVHVHGSTLQ